MERGQWPFWRMPARSWQVQKRNCKRAWPQEEELRNKAARLAELNIELDVGGRDSGAAALDEIEAAEEKALPGKDRDGVAR